MLQFLANILWRVHGDDLHSNILCSDEFLYHVRRLHDFLYLQMVQLGAYEEDCPVFGRIIALIHHN